MAENDKKILVGKVVLKGTIECLTPLHIGGSQDSLQIGGLDAPVLKDPITKMPYIPGSSVKGKLRSTLERTGKRVVNGREEELSFNRNIGTYRNPVHIHCCDDASLALECEVCRVFGSSAHTERGPKSKEKSANFPARLLVRDGKLLNPESIKSDILTITTERKVENSIDRVTASANIRTIERVPQGTLFSLELVYSVDALGKGKDSSPSFNPKHLTADLHNLFTTLEIVEDDALGGFGSRGSGKVKFKINEFMGRPLAFYQGERERVHSIVPEEKEFSPEECRKSIPALVEFFEKEAANAIHN